MVKVINHIKVHLHKHNAEIMLNGNQFTGKHHFGEFVTGEFITCSSPDKNGKNEIINVYEFINKCQLPINSNQMI